MNRFLIVLATGLATTLSFCAPAFAGGLVVAPLYDLLNQFEAQLAQGLILAAVGYALYLLHQLFLRVPLLGRLFGSSTMDANLAAGLNTALQNGMAIALNKQKSWETAHQSVAVAGLLQTWAAQYAIDHAPQAIAHFGLTPADLALKALAYLPPPPSLMPAQQARA